MKGPLKSSKTSKNPLKKLSSQNPKKYKRNKTNKNKLFWKRLEKDIPN
jgi:hypothetical protein